MPSPFNPNERLTEMLARHDRERQRERYMDAVFAGLTGLLIVGILALAAMAVLP